METQIDKTQGFITAAIAHLRAASEALELLALADQRTGLHCPDCGCIRTCPRCNPPAKVRRRPASPEVRAKRIENLVRYREKVRALVAAANAGEAAEADAVSAEAPGSPPEP